MKIDDFFNFLNTYIKHIKGGLIFLSLISLIVFWYPIDTYKDFGNISWILLLVVMMIRPLKDLFPKCKIFLFILKLRRELGILVGIFGIAHTIGYIILMQYKNYIDIFYDPYVWKYDKLLFWGMLGFCISIPLLITSNGFSTQLLGKHCKRLQRLSYFMFIFVAIHIFLIKGEFFPLLSVGVWIGLFIGAYIKNKKNMSLSGPGPKWLCVPCGYIYNETLGDPDSGILPGTKFEDIPNDWLCPVCGVGKKDFILINGDIDVNESKIVNITYLNDDVIEIILDLQKDISYISGQFLTFALKDNLGDFYRSYSIANKQGTHYTFLIKLKENGKAGILLKTFKVGDSIHYTNISGNFHLQKTQNPKVFIATGTGLAPIYSLLGNTQTDISKKLYFGVTRKKDLFYVDKIKEIKNLEVTICVSQEEVEFFHFGRIDISNEVFEKNTEFYICGNPGLIDSIKKSLYEKGYTQVYCEEF